MNKLTKTAVVVTTAVALLAGGGAAYGYWSAVGAGTGTAATGSSAAALTVEQAAPTEALVPGGSIDLNGTITNPNKFTVGIQGLDATIDSVTPAAGLVCAASNYSVKKVSFWTTSDSIDGIKPAAPQTNSVEWYGVRLSMVDAATNQDGCKGATVKIAYKVL